MVSAGIVQSLSMDSDSLNTSDSAAASPSADATKRSAENSESSKPTISDRRFQRVRTLLTGVLIVDEVLVDVTVLDISANGARVRAKSEVPDVQEVMVRVNGMGQFHANIRWREGDTFGVQFMEEPQEVVRNLGGRLKDILAK